MEAIQNQVKELMVNQHHILEAIKYLKDKVEEDKNGNDGLKEIQDIIESQAMIDELIVKNSDDIQIIKRSREEANTALKSIDVKIAIIQKEMEAMTKNTEDKEKKVKLEQSNDKVDNKFKDDMEKVEKCNLCNSVFVGKKLLKDHMKREHKRKVKCDHCDESFEMNIQLEKHMDSHKKEKHFKCDLCEKTFYLEWRLRKHIVGHDSPSKFCHYFNNNEECPYEKNGCMFSHSESPHCKYKELGSNQLCQFKHDVSLECSYSENHTNVDNTTNENFVTSTPKKRKHSCDECENKSQCIDCFVNQETSSSQTLKKKQRIQFSETNLQI